MDLRTGQTFETREDALKAGVPDSDIAEVVRQDGSLPEVRFANGPFKDRVYKRGPSGQLIRVSGHHKGWIEKTNGRGAVVRVRA